MNRITEIALQKATRGIFTRRQATLWVGNNGASLDALLKRGVGSGEILRIRQGLYVLSNMYRPYPVNPFELSQRMYGPSYISFESALSYHEWIPEAVYGICSSSLARTRSFSTPLGVFRFTRTPQHHFFTAVTRVSEEIQGSYFMASPLKALVDYVYVHRHDWVSAQPLLESLRIDEEQLLSLTGDLFDELTPLYKSPRVRAFLEGLRKDLKK